MITTTRKARRPETHQLAHLANARHIEAGDITMKVETNMKSAVVIARIVPIETGVRIETERIEQIGRERKVLSWSSTVLAEEKAQRQPGTKNPTKRPLLHRAKDARKTKTTIESQSENDAIMKMTWTTIQRKNAHQKENHQTATIAHHGPASTTPRQKIPIKTMIDRSLHHNHKTNRHRCRKTPQKVLNTIPRACYPNGRSTPRSVSLGRIRGEWARWGLVLVVGEEQRGRSWVGGSASTSMRMKRLY